jgi:hypothetical protein
VKSGASVGSERLEQATNHRSRFREDPEFNADLACLGHFELRRASDALSAGIAGDTERAAEASILLERAHARRLAGWTQADTNALRKQEWDKKRAVWAFTGALGRSHQGFYPQSSRFDVLDLTEPEIKQLAQVTETATCADDLDTVADIVGRLRLDGRVIDMTCFEELVLRGVIAPPRQPDRQDIQRQGEHPRL